MTDVPPLLLAIDDEPAILTIVERFGRQMGFEVETRTNPAAALAEFSKLDPDVAVVDLQMPELGGLDVLKAIREANPDCHVILLTGNPTIDTAIAAVKLGARDYLQKPIDFGRLGRLLSEVVDGIRRRERLLRVEADVAGDFECEGMIGRSTVMQELFDSLRRYAPHMRTVLVTGETGTGKELVARALHRLGPRRAKRFITVNCSAVVESLFESELFGHVRGAFTGATDAKVGLFEHADGGTLFLDEAGELPLPLQAKLLRAVEYGELQRVGSLDTRRVDVNVIAATNRNLRAEAAAGRFRTDLFYRLSTIEIVLPPLRDRREDIPYLAARFIRECAARVNRPITGLTQSAERLLFNAPWPGNIRELRNVLERACILSEAGMIAERDLASALTNGSPVRAMDVDDAPDDRLSTLQRRQVERVLEETGGNKSEAARRLGISRRALYRRIDEMNLTQ
ncbi:MAG TPA: sigma-54 dependent transcriptional regulator [Vicinamibacterales bacterium]|jgi:DNA-binding NtrC family response regulator|nr:sigma-54 dependent transcriptional regulator [Vicinamibacterales bacterium]